MMALPAALPVIGFRKIGLIRIQIKRVKHVKAVS
jgi:hypothetical protein